MSSRNSPALQGAAALLIGLLFGLGLTVSGMSDPAKVRGVLDLGRAWDPSLILVMGGAVAVAALGFALAKQRGHAVLDPLLRWPTATRIDRRLVLGSLTVGVGWGLAGFCPGPALASLTRGLPEPLIFVLAMLAGMALFELCERWREMRSSRS